jgi:hypothetical protein
MALLPFSGLLRWVLLIQLVSITGGLTFIFYVLFTLKTMDKVLETSGSQEYTNFISNLCTKVIVIPLHVSATFCNHRQGVNNKDISRVLYVGKW